jgi:hypothetical protein
MSGTLEITGAARTLKELEQIYSSLRPSLWRIRTYPPQFKFNNVIRFADFSPDDKILATVHDGGEIVFWDLVGQRPTARKMEFDGLELPKSCITSLAFPVSDIDNVALSFVGQDRHIIQLFNLKTNTAGPVLFGSFQNPHCIRYSQNGNMMAWAADDQVELWDAKLNQHISTLKMQSLDVGGQVVRVSFSTDSGYIAAVNEKGTVVCWDTATRLNIRQSFPEIPLNRGSWTAIDLAVSVRGEEVVMLMAKKLDNGRQELRQVNWHTSGLRNEPLSTVWKHACISPSCRYICNVYGLNGNLGVVDVANSPLCGAKGFGNDKPVVFSQISPSSKAMVAQQADGQLAFWKVSYWPPMIIPLRG